MKISSLLHKIKDALPRWQARAIRLAVGIGVGIVVAPLSGLGCAPLLAEAPFSARPDTVEPGDLAGPFDGRVVDAATGHPVAGAIVFASWGLEVGRGLQAPAGAVTATVETDSDGRYLVDRLNSWPGRRTRVERFTLLVYKRGYVGYRSDRRFDDLGLRRDFSQKDNAVKLERYPSGLSHVKHVRFLGGGGALRTALSGEYTQASLELAGQAPKPDAPTPERALLDVSRLLSDDELRAVTGYGGKFTIDRLEDVPQSANYDSKHFRAEGKPESFDAAIRVWRLPTAQAADVRWRALAMEVPHAEEGHELGDASLRGWDGRILAGATEKRELGLVIELTCGVDLCRDAAQAMALLRRVLARAERLDASAKPEGRELFEKPQRLETPSNEEPSPEEPAGRPKQENPFQLRPPELRR